MCTQCTTNLGDMALKYVEVAGGGGIAAATGAAGVIFPMALRIVEAAEEPV